VNPLGRADEPDFSKPLLLINSGSFPDSRAQFVRRHATLSKITADYSAAFLAFDDSRRATATLGALNAEPSIVLALSLVIRDRAPPSGAFAGGDTNQRNSQLR
jgi:hypothetical protein